MAIGTTAFPTSLDTVVELVEVKNNASSTLSGNVLIGDVTIGVTDIAEFPTTGFGTLTDDLTTPTKTEIISWTGISGSNLTGCTRGAQGTSAAAFSSGNFIEVRPTAGHHEALRGAVIAIETKLGTGTSIAVNKLAALTASRLPVLDASGFLSASSVTATEAGYLSGVTSAIQTQLNAKGAGDVVGPASATDDAIARFDLTTGKLIQNSVVTIADTTGNMAGVGTLNTHTIPAGTDTFVLLAANQTLTTKTLTSPDINGGTADSLTSLSVRSTGAAFDLLFANAEVLTGNKTLTFKVNDTSRTIDLAGNLTLAAAFSTSGANALTLTTTGATNVTLPTTGTLAIVGGTLAQFASTTSSQLAGVISDETGSGSLVFGTAPTFASTIAIGTAGGTTGAINLNGTTSGTVTLKVADVAGTYTLTLPANDGDASQFLQTDGAGVLTWATGGGGITIGTTAITSGTAGRILYETAGNLVGETAGFTYQPAASPNLTITAQAASYVGLRINSAATPSVNIFETTVNGGAGTGFVVTSTGAPSSTGTGGAGAERFGLLSTISVARGVAIGWTANVSVIDGIAIGYNASVTTTASGGIAIGTNNNAQGGSIAMSNGNTTATGGALAIQATGTYAGLQTIYIGQYSGGGGTGGSGPGGNPQAAIAIGGGGKPEGDNNAVFSTLGGTVGDGIGRVWFGKGVRHATPTSVTINGTGGSGTNIAGAAINLAGGKGTGTGTGGDVNIQFARAGSTGSSLNSLSTIMAFSGTTTATTATQTNVNGSTTITGQITESITLNTGGTTTDSTIDLPANSIILSVTGRITTTITTATDWKLGDATIADRFSDANATLTSGTTTVGINQWKADRTTAGQGAFQQSTAKVRITTTGTPGAGVIRITIHYITLSAPTS